MASALSCRACRRTVLESFASFAGLSLRPTTRIPVTRTSPAATTVLSSPNTRFFRTISTPLRQEVNTETKPDPSHNAQTTSEFQPYSASTTAPASDPSIPWYMQYETPEPLSTMTQNPLLASQEIPPIPHDAPAILEPILQHLSITIGLDNLSLLDLRELNPPAALGSNLLMIIGTARSQKHLNTSADRFCRWMRSEYKLRPFADGLLGRNEMKLKLRRKNRRLKLARTVGNTVATEGVDDGISTGWICCNLGSVSDVAVPESSNTKAEETSESTGHVRLSQKDQERILENEEEEYKNPTEDFVYRGFGDSADQVKIVVQMFVEEKRAEMDLEGLWETRVMRREKREESLDYRPEFEDEDTPLDAEEVQKKLEEFQKDDESHIEEEIENEEAREGEDVSKPLGGIGAS